MEASVGRWLALMLVSLTRMLLVGVVTEIGHDPYGPSKPIASQYDFIISKLLLLHCALSIQIVIIVGEYLYSVLEQ